MRGGVDLDVPEANTLLGHPVCRGAAAQHCAHPRHQLPRRERFRHVIVGTELEPDDPVRLLAARCQHHDRQIGPRPDPAAELEPVDPGQHHVEDDQRRGIAVEQELGLVAACRLQGAEAVAPQVADNHVAHDRFVVDNQNRRHLPIVGRRIFRPS